MASFTKVMENKNANKTVYTSSCKSNVAIQSRLAETKISPEIYDVNAGAEFSLIDMQMIEGTNMLTLFKHLQKNGNPNDLINFLFQLIDQKLRAAFEIISNWQAKLDNLLICVDGNIYVIGFDGATFDQKSPAMVSTVTVMNALRFEFLQITLTDPDMTDYTNCERIHTVINVMMENRNNQPVEMATLVEMKTPPKQRMDGIEFSLCVDESDNDILQLNRKFQSNTRIEEDDEIMPASEIAGLNRIAREIAEMRGVDISAIKEQTVSQNSVIREIATPQDDEIMPASEIACLNRIAREIAEMRGTISHNNIIVDVFKPQDDELMPASEIAGLNCIAREIAEMRGTISHNNIIVDVFKPQDDELMPASEIAGLNCIAREIAEMRGVDISAMNGRLFDEERSVPSVFDDYVSMIPPTEIVSVEEIQGNELLIENIVASSEI